MRLTFVHPMNPTRVQFHLIALLCGTVFFGATTQSHSALRCVVCDKNPLTGRYWKHPHGDLCNDCYRIDIRCDVCQLPIKSDYIQTKDGRYICKYEKDDVVIDEPTAKLLYKSAVDSVLYVSGNRMRLHGPEPDVRLFDIDYWNQTGGERKPNAMRRGGFSQTRSVGNRFTHNVILLSGLPKDELVGVSAHEFTHLWINENRPESRKLEADTIEGICELMAYKVCERAGFTNQLDRIKKNPYTKGRILDALEADRQIGLGRILIWVKSGRGETLPYDGKALASQPPPRSSRPPAPVVQKPSPTRPPTAAAGATPQQKAAPQKRAGTGLKLSSIARTARGYRAEINGVQFYQGDLRRVSINGRLANLQCIEVTSRGVMFSVNRGHPTKLKLSR
jgi:hypothetical protein